VIPNPWDLERASPVEFGFPPLRPPARLCGIRAGDNHATLEDTLAHRLIAQGVAVPVNADFEGGFAIEPSRSASM
jgi:methylisocitrate lyase